MLGDLVYYEDYLRRLRAYARGIRVRLTFSCEAASEGVWVPNKRAVRVDSDLTEAQTIAVILHELGHVLDDTLITGKQFRIVNRAYAKYYDLRCSKKQRQLVKYAEVRAWEYGRVIAKILGIRLGKWYDKESKACLKSYKL